MNATIKSLTCPAGKSGLAVAPWSLYEIYAVAANWAQASDTVMIYGRDGWAGSQYQVADFRHRPADALRAVLVEAIATSEGTSSEDVDDDAVDSILAKARRI